MSKIFEYKTEFDKIKLLLKKYVQGVKGGELIDKLAFVTDKETVAYNLALTDEMKYVLMYDSNFPIASYSDISYLLMSKKVAGTYFDLEEIIEIKKLIHQYIEIENFFNKDKDNKYPLLKKIFAPKAELEICYENINEIISPKNLIKENASVELLRITKEKDKKRHEAQVQMAKMLQSLQKQQIVSVKTELTIRSGRAVIPIEASKKRSIKGVVHDESASGQTSFVEPLGVFELNNQIRQLELAEKREIIRLLTQLTDKLRIFFDALEALYHYVGIMDFIKSKARLAVELNAIAPIITEKPEMEICNANHPLLYLSLKRDKKEVVPLNIKMDKNQRIVVISGPNAGGKSICLKTIGLLQYMVQCGLLVPVKDGTIMRLFSHFFIDIGDEQSVENDLSTYSSHLKNMRYLLKKADKNTLFLIDEFGTGTEPQIGGAIAESILYEMLKKQSFGVVTTHYANLKKMADSLLAVSNASMLFDKQNLQPLFVLKMGVAGSSFAFELAQKMGLPGSIIKKAKQLAGKTSVDYDTQLDKLENKQKEIDEKHKTVLAAEKVLNELIDKEKQKLAYIETSKKDIIKQAKEEAAELLSKSNKIIENTISSIKEHKADKQKTKQARAKIEHFKQTIQPVKQESIVKSQKGNVIDLGIIKGDFVTLKGQTAVGKVVEIKGYTAEVEFGSFKLHVQVEKLEKVQKHKEKTKTVLKVDTDAHSGDFKMQKDIRGMRGEEAVDIVERFVNQAIELNVKQIKILHGKGNGILRDLVRKYLKTVEDVQSFIDEDIRFGGTGITIVRLK